MDPPHNNCCQHRICMDDDPSCLLAVWQMIYVDLVLSLEMLSERKKDLGQSNDVSSLPRFSHRESLSDDKGHFKPKYKILRSFF